MPAKACARESRLFTGWSGPPVIPLCGIAKRPRQWSPLAMEKTAVLRLLAGWPWPPAIPLCGIAKRLRQRSPVAPRSDVR